MPGVRKLVRLDDPCQRVSILPPVDGYWENWLRHVATALGGGARKKNWVLMTTMGFLSAISLSDINCFFFFFFLGGGGYRRNHLGFSLAQLIMYATGRAQ